MTWTAGADKTTGTLVTASSWNSYLGATGSLMETATAKVTTAGDIVYATGANALARLAVGSTGQRLSVVSGAPAWSTMTTSIALLGADVTMSIGAYTDLVSLSLGAGTWLLLGSMTCDSSSTAGGTQLYGGRLYNSTSSTLLKEQDVSTSGTTNAQSSVLVMDIVVLGSTSTIKLQATATSNAAVVRKFAANVTGTPPGVQGTQLLAVQLV